ncbi:MAG TPA: mevalonate kinase [Candidatus Methanofastidiosa archaeon]|nr:mevalonate kinase [Candidatus Methanofastidiosa archaeon]
MGFGSGFGKVILFNEHFVVHGVPAIVSAISMKTTATAERTGGEFEFYDDRMATPGYKDDKMEHQRDSLKYIFDAMGLDQDGVRIGLAGDLYAASGVGASAASCAAIARALSDEFDLDFSDENINRVAYEGERGYHGSPSGIDNTAATFGGLIWFQKGSPNIMERMNLKRPVNIVMGNTGVVANTKAAVAGVQERKESFPEKYGKIFRSAEELAIRGREAIKTFDLDALGGLMNENHRLLQEIEVSNGDLDMLVDLARDEGAIGAKMTGGGLGGYMVALTPEDEVQENVASAIEKKGFKVLRTKIGV